MVVAASGGRARNLTNSPGVADWSPAWSPDGRSIAFFSMRAGGRDIWVMRQTARERRLTRDGSLNEYPTWSPNGRTIVFQSTRDGEFELYAMASDGRRQRNLTRHPSEDKWAAWSPDGKWIAFMSMRDGSEDVFVILRPERDPDASAPGVAPLVEPGRRADVLPSRRQRPDRTLEHPCGCRRPTAGYSRGAGLRLRLGSDPARWASSQASRLPVAGPESRPRGRPGRGRTARRSR